MPDETKDFDNLEITAEEILPAEELETEPADAADTLPAEPVPEPAAEEGDPEEDPATPEDVEDEEADAGDDGLVEVLRGLRDTIDALNARVQASEVRLAEYEKREAARSQKLSGFFAPVKDGKDPDVDPLPRIEKKYIY